MSNNIGRRSTQDIGVLLVAADAVEDVLAHAKVGEVLTEPARRHALRALRALAACEALWEVDAEGLEVARPPVRSIEGAHASVYDGEERVGPVVLDQLAKLALRQLWDFGPVLDEECVSKDGRATLLRARLAFRRPDGRTILTGRGEDVGLELGFGDVEPVPEGASVIDAPTSDHVRAALSVPPADEKFKRAIDERRSEIQGLADVGRKHDAEVKRGPGLVIPDSLTETTIGVTKVCAWRLSPECLRHISGPPQGTDLSLVSHGMCSSCFAIQSSRDAAGRPT